MPVLDKGTPGECRAGLDITEGLGCHPHPARQLCAVHIVAFCTSSVPVLNPVRVSGRLVCTYPRKHHAFHHLSNM